MCSSSLKLSGMSVCTPMKNSLSTLEKVRPDRHHQHHTNRRTQSKASLGWYGILCQTNTPILWQLLTVFNDKSTTFAVPHGDGVELPEALLVAELVRPVALMPRHAHGVHGLQ